MEVVQAPLPCSSGRSPCTHLFARRLPLIESPNEDLAGDDFTLLARHDYPLRGRGLPESLEQGLVMAPPRARMTNDRSTGVGGSVTRV